MDRLDLIAEIFKRPALWDLKCDEYKSRLSIPAMWKEVAACMGPNVTIDECKRKWKNLRDAYRAEIKRIESRIEKDLLKGTYNPKNDYKSKWAYFEHLKFIKDIRRPRRTKNKSDLTTAENYTFEDDNDIEQFSDFHDTDNIKLEPNDESISMDNEDEYDHDGSISLLQNEKHFEEGEKESEVHIESFAKLSKLKPLKTEKYTDENAEFPDCRCLKRSHYQMQFLEMLEKEEQNLTKSSRLDMTHSSDFTHIGDPDYNFLISFLPQIKKMNELQNLKFRAKMSDFVFSIMSQSLTDKANSI